MGAKGLNLQSSSSLLEPSWATKAQNMIFDNSGRLASRNGWSQITGTPISGTPDISSLAEFVPISGSNVVISAAGHKLYKGTTTLTDITGALTPSADNWKFVNFNGLIYGLQASHPLIQWSGSSNFAATTAASGTVPDGNELLSAFGRLWGASADGQTLKYSKLLDATGWTGTGAGSFNLTSVWGTGNDAIVALAAFNNLLIVFGSRNIIVWSDGTGSVLGMDPNNMAVQDMVAGIGCVARDSVQNVNGDDLVFLSSSGVQSLKRVIIERSNAIRNISQNVRDTLLATVAQEGSVANIKSTYNAFAGFYVLLFPTSTSLFVFDTKVTLEDSTWRVTQWDNFIPRSLLTLHDSSTFYAGKSGAVFQYTGQTDNGGAYICSYSSGWLDIDPEIRARIKMLKRLECVFASFGSGTLSIKWAYDFNDTFNVYQTTIPSSGIAQWNNAQWGVGQWGGGLSTYSIAAPASSSGQFIKIGTDFTVNSSAFALQQMQLYAKVGRII